MSAPTHPRCNTDRCVVCRRLFSAGDRVSVCNIVARVGSNPSNPREVGSWLSGEFELAHVNCLNPSLDDSIVISGR